MSLKHSKGRTLTHYQRNIDVDNLIIKRECVQFGNKMPSLYLIIAHSVLVFTEANVKLFV